jgi:hypothetical protein
MGRELHVLVEVGRGELDGLERAEQDRGVEFAKLEVLRPHTLPESQNTHEDLYLRTHAHRGKRVPFVLSLLELLAHVLELGRESEVALVAAANLHGEAADESRVDL